MTVDDVIFVLKEDQLQVLLINRVNEPFQHTWALPGGFLATDETTAEAARRILHDKAGVSDVYVEQLYTFDGLERDVRGHIPTVAYYALVPEDKLKIANGGRTQQPTLYPVAELPALAFDHDTIIDYALSRLRSKLEYTNVAFSLLPPKFTFHQLQKLYETVLGHTLDKRNFRKKFASLELIEATGEKTGGGRHRPAELYRFKSQTPTEFERWF
jgi:8-oxo-dGTP diphosphatase